MCIISTVTAFEEEMEQENERNGTGESPSLSLQIFVQITTEIKFESFSELPVGSKLLYAPLPCPPLLTLLKIV